VRLETRPTSLGAQHPQLCQSSALAILARQTPRYYHISRATTSLDVTHAPSAALYNGIDYRFLRAPYTSYFLTSTFASRSLLYPVKSALPNGYLAKRHSRLFGISASTRGHSKKPRPQSHIVTRHVVLSRPAIPRWRWLRRAAAASEQLRRSASSRVPSSTAKLRCSVSRQ
jgi:hypothetical protein